MPPIKATPSPHSVALTRMEKPLDTCHRVGVAARAVTAHPKYAANESSKTMVYDILNEVDCAQEGTLQEVSNAANTRLQEEIIPSWILPLISFLDIRRLAKIPSRIVAYKVLAYAAQRFEDPNITQYLVDYVTLEQNSDMRKGFLRCLGVIKKESNVRLDILYHMIAEHGDDAEYAVGSLANTDDGRAEKVLIGVLEDPMLDIDTKLSSLESLCTTGGTKTLKFLEEYERLHPKFKGNIDFTRETIKSRLEKTKRTQKKGK